VAVLLLGRPAPDQFNERSAECDSREQRRNASQYPGFNGIGFRGRHGVYRHYSAVGEAKRTATIGGALAAGETKALENPKSEFRPAGRVLSMQLGPASERLRRGFRIN
jgi:hypothetical protein